VHCSRIVDRPHTPPVCGSIHPLHSRAQPNMTPNIRSRLGPTTRAAIPPPPPTPRTLRSPKLEIRELHSQPEGNLKERIWREEQEGTS